MDLYNLRKFDVTKIKKPCSIIVIGPRGTGKSTLVKDLLKNLDILHGVIWSGDMVYSKIVGAQIIKLSVENITDIEKYAPVTQKSMNLPTFMKDVFIVHDAEGLCYPTLFPRYNDVTTILTRQQHITANHAADYIFIFNEPSLECMKHLYWHCVQTISFTEFQRIFKAIVREPHRCMVVDNNNLSKMEEHFFWYKAREHDVVVLDAVTKAAIITQARW